MKSRMKISEFAKLKNITTETLRHYDRVGLLKPDEIDEKTGYRYYSIFQSEKLSTIIELKALGFSINEMKMFFDNRNLKQTYELLKEKHIELIKRIEEMQYLEKSIAKKSNHLQAMMNINDNEDFIVRDEQSRRAIFLKEEIRCEEEFEVMASEIENKIKRINPVIGSDSYGLLISAKQFHAGAIWEKSNFIYFIDEDVDIDLEIIRDFPKCKSACFTRRGSVENIGKELPDIFRIISENGLKIAGEIILKFRIDCTATNIDSEKIYELQVPVI